MEGNALTIRTSSPNWLGTLANAYKSKTYTYLIDDAGLGIDPMNETLFEMGRKANLSQREWIAVGVSLGVSAAGLALLGFAIADPEPFSKMGFALGTATVLILGGAYPAIRVLVGHKPPSVKVDKGGVFEISWD